MALTITPSDYDVFGKHLFSAATAQPAAADYPTGGYPLTSSEFGFGANQNILSVTGSASAKGSTPVTTTVVLGWDYVNQKLQAFESGPENVAAQPLAEVANGADLSGWQFNLTVLVQNN